LPDESVGIEIGPRIEGVIAAPVIQHNIEVDLTHQPIAVQIPGEDGQECHTRRTVDDIKHVRSLYGLERTRNRRTRQDIERIAHRGGEPTEKVDPQGTIQFGRTRDAHPPELAAACPGKLGQESPISALKVVSVDGQDGRAVGVPV